MNEAKIMSIINSLRPETAYKVVSKLGYGPAISVCEEIALRGTTVSLGGELDSLLGDVESPKLETPEDLLTLVQSIGYSGEQGVEMAQELVSWAWDLVEAKEEEVRLQKRDRLLQKTSNRSEYLEQVTLLYREYKNRNGEEMRGWRGDASLKCSGLLARVIDMEYGPQSGPAAVQIVNALPLDENGKQPQIPKEEFEKLWAAGLVTSGMRVGWNLHHPAWGWLVRTFPNAVDLAPYNHSLNAPVLPEGFMPNSRIVLKELRDANGVSLGADGHGFYHPDSPEVNNFVLKYGAVPMQVRGINKQGLFVKGMLFPSDSSVDEQGKPCITVDWLQVKGRHKALAKERLKTGAVSETQIHLGVINVWRKHGKLPLTFEVLENIKMCPESINLIKELVDKAMAKLARGGVDALMAGIAEDNAELQLILQLITQMKAEGLTIEPTQIPRVKELLEDRLCHKLWQIAQGAGVKTPYSVVQLDATLCPGTCVIEGQKAGQSVLVYRYPTVLSQGLHTLKTTKPLKHHLAHGKMSPATIIMHPEDLITRLQGDSDGDIVGWSNDETLLKLWEYVEASPFVIHVEPEGERLEIDSRTREGWEYILYDQRGPVGSCTNLRAAALAIGRRDLADGMSFGIQEAIDEAKRKVAYTDFRAASDYDNYEDGHCAVKLPVSLYEGGKFPQELANQWIGQHLIEEGCFYVLNAEEGQELRPRNALGWRHKNKRVDFRNWKSTVEESGWDGGNLVHICHDYAMETWRKFESAINLEAPEVSIALLLPILLQKKGLIQKMDQLPTPREYEIGLRTKCGLRAHGRTYSELMRKHLPDEERNAHFDQATEVLQSSMRSMTIEELATIWVMECTSGTSAGLNNAMRAIAFPGSPIMALLGISNDTECEFLTPKGLEMTVEKVFSADEPVKTLIDLIHANTSHEQRIIKNGEAVPGWCCQSCVEKMTNAVIRRIRRDKSRAEHTWMKNMIRSLGLTA